MDENRRLSALRWAEDKAQQLFDAIEAKGLIAPGRSEREVEQDIFRLAAQDFDVEKHWHKRIVRAGINTLTIAADNPEVIDIQADDMVFIDLGPVFEEWEADVGRTYVLGDDPEKHRLAADLPRHFEKLRHFYDAHPDITGEELFAEAERLAQADGWLWGGQIAGHLVGEFPHARIPGDKDLYRISPHNPSRMRDPDAAGAEKYWILEVHLVNQDRSWGGFYERLLLPEPN